MRAPLLLAILAGIVAATGQAPLDFWWLSLAGLAGAFYLFSQHHPARSAAWLGWYAGLGYFATTLFWIVEPFLVDIERHGWMAPFALLLLSGGLALLWGAAFWLAARFRLGALGLVATWTGAEALRAVLFTGFPWALIGYGWLETPVAQFGAFVGPHGLSLLYLLIAALPSIFSRRLGSLLAVLLLGGFWVVGSSVQTTATFSDKTVRLVQPNAAQHLKWDSDMVPVFLERQLALTAAQSEKRPDLVIWPETSIAYRVSRAGEVFKRVAEATGGAPAIVGANSVLDQVRFYNTAIVLDGQGEIAARYYKHHLVPFGEYIPFGNLLSRIGIRGLAARDGSGFSAGPGPQLLDIPGIGRALPMICYELIFPRNFRGTERPDMIIQITNDAWFGKISGPYQHLAQARMRAIEQGLPVLRTANTGVSAVIGPHGQLIAQTKLGEAVFLDALIPEAIAPTFYALRGDGPILVFLVLLLILARSVRRPLAVDAGPQAR